MVPERLAVAVGSRNPVKVNSVKNAFQVAFPQCEIIVSTHEVPSGVPDQPWGDDQTRQGALNRAIACHAAHLAAVGSAPDFAVGLEGGVVEEFYDKLHPTVPGMAGCSMVSCFAFMAIMGAALDGGATAPPRWGIARTASFQLPPKIIALMRGEPPMELGDADDAVFNEVNSKQKGGTVAKATNGMIDRTQYYEHALQCALAPFLHDAVRLYASVGAK